MPAALEVAAQVALDASRCRRGPTAGSRAGTGTSRGEQRLGDRHQRPRAGWRARAARQDAHRLGDASRTRSGVLATKSSSDPGQEGREVEEIRDAACSTNSRRFGLVEVAGAEVRELVRAALELAHHLRRRDAAGERRGEEGAGREADVDVEVGGLAVDQEVVEGLQAAELEGAAGDGAAGQHQRDARVALAGGEVALLNDRDAHIPLPGGPLASRVGRSRHRPRATESLPFAR